MSNRFCINCGTPLEEGQRFCTNCGFKIEENDNEDNKVRSSFKEEDILSFFDAIKENSPKDFSDAAMDIRSAPILDRKDNRTELGSTNKETKKEKDSKPDTNVCSDKKEEVQKREANYRSREETQKKTEKPAPNLEKDDLSAKTKVTTIENKQEEKKDDIKTADETTTSDNRNKVVEQTSLADRRKERRKKLSDANPEKEQEADAKTISEINAGSSIKEEQQETQTQQRRRPKRSVSIVEDASEPATEGRKKPQEVISSTKEEKLAKKRSKKSTIVQENNIDASSKDTSIENTTSSTSPKVEVTSQHDEPEVLPIQEDETRSHKRKKRNLEVENTTVKEKNSSQKQRKGKEPKKEDVQDIIKREAKAAADSLTTSDTSIDNGDIIKGIDREYADESADDKKQEVVELPETNVLQDGRIHNPAATQGKRRKRARNYDEIDLYKLEQDMSQVKTSDYDGYYEDVLPIDHDREINKKLPIKQILMVLGLIGGTALIIIIFVLIYNSGLLDIGT